MVTFREAFWVWVKVALNSFGGPAAQIAVMHRYLVEEKRWISEERFLHALNYCMLLPGPEAQQLATYIGWLLNKTRGGIVAGALFVLPGFLFMLVLSILYAGYQDLSVVQWLFFGLKPAVLAIVLEAVLRIGKRALKNRLMITLAVLAFVAIFFYDVPFPIIVLSAAVIGFLGSRFRPDAFAVSQADRKGQLTCDGPAIDVLLDAGSLEHVRPSLVRSAGVLFVWSILWLGPILLIFLYLGSENVYFQEAAFFSKTAVVTFGGAYAVLAYVAQQAVDSYGWLKPGEMLDGLGLAETTPGPLILVLQFVGFLGAYRNPGGLDPMLAGVLGSALTVWVTFVPCFLFIFLGAPYIEALRENKSLKTAMSSITAAVVGVVLNLAVWFALNTIFGSLRDVYVLGAHLQVPVLETANLPSLCIAIVALLALFRFKIGMIYTIAGCAGLGVAYHVIRMLIG
ncbi:MAG: chromate efflux transporter [Desulfomonile tiedjei]|nr:chromate efflux transporter [Desulfomonile tiedjei]